LLYYLLKLHSYLLLYLNLNSKKLKREKRLTKLKDQNEKNLKRELFVG
jgi:hypothetical protein